MSGLKNASLGGIKFCRCCGGRGYSIWRKKK